MNRGERLAHAKRLKEKRKRYWNHWDEPMTPKQKGIVSHTPAVCSCWMCGHQRKHHGLRVQEKRQLQDINE